MSRSIPSVLPTSLRRWIRTRLPTCSADLPEDRTAQILLQMEPAAQQGVVELLEFKEETAAGRMNTEYLALPVNATVQSNRQRCASLKAAWRLSAPSTWSTPTEPWSEPFPWRSWCWPPSAPMLSLHPGALDLLLTRAPEENEVAELFDKYNLLTLPVVDEHNKLTGVITSDDVISLLRAKL